MQAAVTKLGPIATNKTKLFVVFGVHGFLLLMYLILGGLIFRGYAPAGATLAAEVFRYMGGLIGILIAIVIIFMIATDQFTQFLLHAVVVVLVSALFITLGWMLDANTARILGEVFTFPGYGVIIVGSNAYGLAIAATIFGVFAMFSSLFVALIVYIYKTLNVVASVTQAVDVPNIEAQNNA